MAKKSSNRRHPVATTRTGVALKPQASTATLVRASGADANGAAPAASTPAAPKPSSPAAASIVRDTPAKATPKPAPKPVTPPKAAAPTAKPAATPAKAAAPAVSGKRQDHRVARARATQRARQAGLISAENYSYVLGDLKLVAVLATTAFAILIGLAIFLPH